MLLDDKLTSGGNNNSVNSKDRIAGSLIAVLAIILVFIFIASRNHTPYAQKYKEVQTALVKGKDNVSIILNKPAEFTPQNKEILNTPYQIYEQREALGNKTVIAAYLLVSVSPLSSDEKSVIDTVNHAFTKNPNDPYYKSAKRPMESYVNGTYTGLYKNVTVGNPIALKTPNLKKDAYIFDIAATAAKNGAPDQQGKAIYTWTDKYVYFYVLSVAKENWQPNIATWQDMINSFKPVETP